MNFEARYHGKCTACGEHIDPGDRVTYEHDALVHEECNESMWPDAQVTVCSGCWLAKPCGCDDT